MRLLREAWQAVKRLFMTTPSKQLYLDMDSKLKSFTEDLSHRTESINSAITEINEHLQEFRRVQNNNNLSVDKIMSQFEQDIPRFEDQTNFECGIFPLPYGEDNRLYFNPTVVTVNGEDWLIVRNCQIEPHKQPPYNSFSKLTRYRILSDTELGPGTDIPLPLGRTKLEQWEDPRIFNSGTKLWLTCTNFIQRKTYAHQTMAVLDHQWNILGINHPVYGNNGHDLWANKGHEKNWTWFLHEDEVYMIYNIEPHTIVKCDSAASPVDTMTTELEKDIWFYGQRRGGSNPIRIGDEYFAFFHSSTPWWNGRRRYYMGAYAFEAKPPFRITRSSTIPLLYGSAHNRRVLEFPLVIFPGGSLYDEEKQEHFVVFGVNDFESGWIRIPHKDLLSTMRVYYDVQKEKEKHVPTSASRLPNVSRVEKVTGPDFNDAEIPEDYGDEGGDLFTAAGDTKAVNKPAPKRKPRRAAKASKS